ncbi:hypothetical protein HSR122_2800 [Halapricum desulfuricans]|uniref:Uncharacterized protein n=1 Tax=Halapricum desulfuricans TaxID=2841257 RepID=A0A897NGS8_9EURY|nr:hypothetical protein HSR122_2800 [Halapricum desulfuricans]
MGCVHAPHTSPKSMSEYQSDMTRLTADVRDSLGETAVSKRER